MRMLGDKKYRLLRSELVSNRLGGVAPKRLHRVQALVNIPRHGVKKGDIGGYVLNRHTLSHSGDCWIGGDAQALESVYIIGDAYIGDNAILDGQGALEISVFGNARIVGNARISCWMSKEYPKESKHSSTYHGNFEASGNAKIYNLENGSGDAKIYGDAVINFANQISGTSEIYGYAQIGAGAKVLGNSKIYDYAVIEKHAVICDSIFSEQSKAVKDTTYANEVLPKRKAMSVGQEPSVKTPEVAPAVSQEAPKVALSATELLLSDYHEIIAEIASYETDIVKIIKYPVMTDSTDPHTLNMVLSYKKAKRLAKRPETPDFAEAVADLEAKFTIAESNALKIAATRLSEAEQKKVKLAKDILSKASNEGSTENEKKVAFVQGFKHLEGVLVVPEVALDTFRMKIGLKELEV